MSWGVYNWNDLVGKSLSIEPILSTEVSMAVDYDVRNMSQQNLQVDEVPSYCTQNLTDLQCSVQELQQNLKEAIAMTDRLNTQKAILQQRVILLEKCLKCSQLERSLSQQKSEQLQNNPEDHPQNDQSNEQEEEEPLPKCETLEEAMQVIKDLRGELQQAKYQLDRSQTERIELARAVAEQSVQQTQQLQEDQEYQLQRQNSGFTEVSDALYIAEEMSYKVVLLQAEKEELGDALAELQMENVQIKMVNQQLEQQVNYLIQQSANNNTGKRRGGYLARRRLIRSQ
eukprot:TRINITY_DN5131_c0_g1_i2.p1 TRINITY_DN5131_c0_g1~~TRINITY_DN5131_c0_g1_i2.p1  ORF type:complete len:285 (+),score=65.79 TRINITY_DN5131_c0_g1_i2:203-1057(+)